MKVLAIVSFIDKKITTILEVKFCQKMYAVLKKKKIDKTLRT